MPRCSSTPARAAAKHKQRPGNGRRTVAVAFGNVRSSPCLPHGSQTTVLQAHGEVGLPLPPTLLPRHASSGTDTDNGPLPQGTTRRPSDLSHNDLASESGSSSIPSQAACRRLERPPHTIKDGERENRLFMLTATAGIPQAVPGTTNTQKPFPPPRRSSPNAGTAGRRP